MIDDESNTWNSGFDVSALDFASLSTAGVDAARLADGSLPFSEFLRLASGSDLIDAGQFVGTDFFGAAPDLGVFEFGSQSVPEPAAGMVLCLGIACLLTRRQRSIS